MSTAEVVGVAFRVHERCRVCFFMRREREERSVFSAVRPFLTINHAD